MSELTLEKSRVVERLGEVESSIQSVHQEIKALIELKKLEHSHFREIIDSQALLMKQIAGTVYGNGQPGLKQTVSGHALTLKLLIWVMTITCGTTLTLGIKAVFETVVKGG